MDYHVVAYTNYELVGLPLPKLWDSFSLLQVKHGQSFPLKQFWKKQVVQYYTRRWYCRYIYPLPGVTNFSFTLIKDKLNIEDNHDSKPLQMLMSDIFR